MIRIAAFLACFLSASVASAIGDYVVPASGGGGYTPGDPLDMSGENVTGWKNLKAYTYDVDAMTDSVIRANSSYPFAATYNSGGYLYLRGGLGSYTVTIDSYTNCTGGTLTVTVNGVAYPLTEGVDWTAMTDNSLTCLSLNNAVQALSGIDPNTTCSAAILGIQTSANVYSFDLADGTAPACLTLFEGGWAEIYLNGAVTAEDTLTVTNGFDSNGPARFYSTAQFDSNVVLLDNAGLYFGTGLDVLFVYNTVQTPDTMFIGVGSDSRTLLIAEQADRATDFGAALTTNPTLRIQSADSTDPNRYGAMYHDGNFSIDAGSGRVHVRDNMYVAGQMDITGSVLGSGTNTGFYGSLIMFGGATGGFPYIGYSTQSTPDTTIMTTGTASNAYVMCERGDAAVDWARALQTNPTFYVMSASADGNMFISLAHDQNVGIIDVGTGGVRIPDYLEMVGGDVADAGAIRLPNAQGLCWESSPATTDSCWTVDSAEYMTATGTANGIAMNDNQEIYFGASSDWRLTWSTATTPDTAIMTLGSDSLAMHLVAPSTSAAAISLPLQTTPTLYVHGSTSDPNMVVSLAYDQNYGVLDTGDRGLTDSGIYIKDHLKIGTTGTHAATGQVRLANNDKICWESNGGGVDRCLMVDSTPKLNSNYEFNLSDSAPLSIGTGRDLQIVHRTSATPDTAFIGLGSESLAVHFMETSDIASTLDTIPLQSNPTVYVHAANFGTNQNTWVSLTHDQNSSVISSQTGAVSIRPNRITVTKGGSVNITMAESILTCSGGGSATLTATNLVPQFAFLLGVTSRISTALTGSTGYDLGDGVDPNLFGSAAAATQGTTTNNPSAAFTNPQFAGALSPVVTFAGGNCTAGSVIVQASYISLQAPWSN